MEIFAYISQRVGRVCVCVSISPIDGIKCVWLSFFSNFVPRISFLFSFVSLIHIPPFHVRGSDSFTQFLLVVNMTTFQEKKTTAARKELMEIEMFWHALSIPAWAKNCTTNPAFQNIYLILRKIYAILRFIYIARYFLFSSHQLLYNQVTHFHQSIGQKTKHISNLAACNEKRKCSCFQCIHNFTLKEWKKPHKSRHFNRVTNTRRIWFVFVRLH